VRSTSKPAGGRQRILSVGRGEGRLRLDKRVEGEVESRMVESGEACDGAVESGTEFLFLFSSVIDSRKAAC
jgi:hypothetical protein